MMDKNTNYKVCVKCIMDTSDPDITFDDNGVCSHCHYFHNISKPNWHPNDYGRRLLLQKIDSIKSEMSKKPYDVAIGLSGGLDSSYLAYVAKNDLNLRMLAVHVDGGWNSELSIKNIENIVRKLDIDLHTYVVDWEEMKDLQRSFILANLSNQDVPQDHAFFAALYKHAQNFGLRHVLSGGNISTEATLPSEWAYNAMDLRHLEGVHKKFGKKELKTFPKVGFFRYYFWNRYIKRMKVLRPLNYLPYNRSEAIRTLENEIDFTYYGGKHFESRFTKWQQLYWRPQKFGFDSRRIHLSSLIYSGQISREEALSELENDTKSEQEAKDETSYVLKKLSISEEEFERVMQDPTKTYRDYPSNSKFFNLKSNLKKFLETRGVSLNPNS